VCSSDLEVAPEFGDERFKWNFDELPVMQEDANAKAERVVALKSADIIKAEVAALEMGYEKKDVPEPKPVPAALQPFVGGNQQPPNEEEEAEEAIAKWRKKCLRRLREGKSPAVAFESQAIPGSISLAILGALETATSPADVNRAFSKAKKWANYP
jgi:hypothetical protein